MPPELWRIVFDHLSLKSLIHLYLTQSSCSGVVGCYLGQKYTSFEIIWEAFPFKWEKTYYHSKGIHLLSWVDFIPLTPQLLQKILDSPFPKFDNTYGYDERRDTLRQLARNPSLTHELIETYAPSEVYLAREFTIYKRDKEFNARGYSKPKVSTPCPPLETLILYENYWAWKELSRSTSLTPAIIKHYSQRWDWKELSSNPCLTPETITEFEKSLDWEELSSNPSLTPEIIQRYVKRWNWRRLSRNPCLTMEIIEMHIGKWDWEEMSANLCLTPEIIDRYFDQLSPHYLFLRQRQLSVSIIEKNFDKFIDPENDLFWRWPQLTQNFTLHNWRVILDHPNWPWDFFIGGQ